jgi:hypothetical protein
MVLLLVRAAAAAAAATPWIMLPLLLFPTPASVSSREIRSL